jgi:exonuclease V gamma subunit
VVTSFSRVGKRMELECFVRHAILGAHLAATGMPSAVSSAIVCQRKSGQAVTVRLAPLPDPRGALEALIALYRFALRSPLPFEHDVSRAYAEARRQPRDHESSLKAAASEFKDAQKWGLGPHLERFYPSFEALKAPRALDFARLAELLFAPLLACRSET